MTDVKGGGNFEADQTRTRLYADSGRCRFEIKLKTGRGDTEKHALVIPADTFGTVPDQARMLLGQVLNARGQFAARQRFVALAPMFRVNAVRKLTDAMSMAGWRAV